MAINKDFTYSPEKEKEIDEIFRCRVPLPSTNQIFVLDGVLKDELKDSKGVSIERGNFGYNISTKKGEGSSDTLQIISVRGGSAELSQVANSIILAEDSKISILLCSHTLDLNSYETKEKLSIELAKGASANIVIMQNENNLSKHETEYSVNLKEGSSLKMTYVTLHGSGIVNKILVDLQEIDSKCELNGLYLVDGTQFVETSVNMNHNVRDCYSKQLFKGILDNESKAMFTGRIYVAPDAQKTQAYQSNHNLLISENARATVQPHLEIYADDVKCSHGATSGRLDEMAAFYMRSRGIGKDEAKLLQQLAFVNDVLDTIDKESLRKRLEELVESRLRGEFSHCKNCSVNCC